MKIDQIHIENFKSIKSLDLKFDKINIFIGGNGVGKSNLISYFKFLNNIIRENLQSYTSKNSGSDSFLYFGRKKSPKFSSSITFLNGYHKNRYSFTLEPTNEDNFFFKEEIIGYDKGSNGTKWYTEFLGSGQTETKILSYSLTKQKAQGYPGVSGYVINAFQSFKVYHFHDTSETAAVKQASNINDNTYLREDASNLASFLYKLKIVAPGNFKQIESTIRIIAPFFDRFNLAPNELNREVIRLEWLEKGSDKYFNANNFSDGTLRMICLITLLLQPNPPESIIIDEPELGLHPSAINTLASIIKSASTVSQIILSTQSVTFVNQFSPENIIVVERDKEQSIFKRISESSLQYWKDEYSLGEIWEKNIIGGRP